MSHYSLAKIVSLAEASSGLTLKQLRERACSQLSAQDVTIEFSRDVIHKLACPGCGKEEEIFAAVGTVPYARGRCPDDGQMRAVITAHNYSGAEPFGERTLDKLGLPLFDVFVARSAEDEIAYVIAGDQKMVLGQLAAGAAR